MCGMSRTQPFRNQTIDRESDELRRVASEQRAGRLIGQHDPALLVDDQERIGGLVDDGPEKRRIRDLVAANGRSARWVRGTLRLRTLHAW